MSSLTSIKSIMMCELSQTLTLIDGLNMVYTRSGMYCLLGYFSLSFASRDKLRLQSDWMNSVCEQWFSSLGIDSVTFMSGL